MAELPSLFDPTEEIDDPFAAIPEGWQVATIKESTVADNKNKNGKYLKLVHTINGGEYNGRKIQSYLNIVNPSTVAESIAKRELKSLCEAIGVEEGFTDSNELHGKPHRIKLKKTPPTAQYGEGNAIAAFASMDDLVEDEDEADPFAA